MSTLTFHKTSIDRNNILAKYGFSNHAKKRLRQRNIWREDVRQAFCYGQVFLCDGILFFALNFDGIPNGKDHILIDELEGIVVLLDPNTKEVITAYRNPNAIPKIERKIRYWSQVHRVEKREYGESLRI